MELEKAKAIAEELKELLAPACERIRIAGSIRRRKPDVGDIEILAIPKFNGVVDLLDHKLKWLIGTHVLEYRPNKKGSIVYRPKNKLLRHADSGIGIGQVLAKPILSGGVEKWVLFSKVSVLLL